MVYTGYVITNFQETLQHQLCTTIQILTTKDINPCTFLPINHTAMLKNQQQILVCLNYGNSITSVTLTGYFITPTEQ